MQGSRRIIFKRPWYGYARELLQRNKQFMQEGGRVLDVGCGVGEFCLVLAEMGFRVKAIDINQKFAVIAKVFGCDCVVSNLDMGLPYKDSSFSVVICLEVIEHVAKAEFLLKEIWRVLEPEGLFLLSTPNFAFLNNRIHYLFGREPLNEGVHLRFFTKRRLLSLLRSSGFELIDNNSYGVIPLISSFMVHLIRREAPLWHVPAILEPILAYDMIYLTRKITA